MMDNIEAQNTQVDNTQVDNTQTDNTAVTEPQTQAPQPQTQAPQPQTQAPQMSMADQLAKKNKQLQTSQITNQFGVTKDITINVGTKYEYTLTIQYPGIAVASQIEDDASNLNGSIRYSDLMQGAVEHGVFAQPHIKNIAFWDTHKGYGEVAGEVLSFLNDGIKGNLE